MRNETVTTPPCDAKTRRNNANKMTTMGQKQDKQDWTHKGQPGEGWESAERATGRTYKVRPLFFNSNLFSNNFWTFQHTLPIPFSPEHEKHENPYSTAHERHVEQAIRACSTCLHLSSPSPFPRTPITHCFAHYWCSTSSHFPHDISTTKNGAFLCLLVPFPDHSPPLSPPLSLPLPLPLSPLPHPLPLFSPFSSLSPSSLSLSSLLPVMIAYVALWHVHIFFFFFLFSFFLIRRIHARYTWTHGSAQTITHSINTCYFFLYSLACSC